MSGMVIAIDGPSASGKSTVAKRVAAELGYLYVDSGAVYRGVTWYLLRHAVNIEDLDNVRQVLDNFPIEFFVADGGVRFRIEEIEPGQELRSERVNAMVSHVAAVAEVRERVTAWLRALTSYGPLVMEGRDIGTVVFPDAVAKFYLDADPSERARRRYEETVARSENLGLSEISRSIGRRDKLDRSRGISPLRPAVDAMIIDTTRLTIDEVVGEVMKRVRERCSRKDLA